MTELLLPATASLDAQLDAELSALDAAGIRRTLRPLVRAGAAHRATPDGARLLDFASNDYLGLATDPRPAAAAAALLAREGLGAGSARLIGGDHPEHHALEAELAALKGTEAALLFPSGYAANTGALPALAGAGDVIYSDALNHASLVDGCRLARANGAAVRVVPHADAGALDDAFGADAGRFRRRWVVVEGVYSMDGDLHPLAEAVAVARRHGAFVYVDDAHATGVVGPDGRGCAAHWGAEADVTVGTLGKAFGASGAFVAGSAALRAWLLNRARSFVFTTASPPALAAGARAALAAAAAEPWRRARTRAAARRLRAALAAAGLRVPGADDGHIVPVLVGDARRAARAGDALRARGILVGAIRPPTVPAGAARLRLSTSAAHTDADVDAAAAAVAAVLGT
ncbi:8-amino-7-oxononanoate synthase [Gemmatimonadetes bacterium T265]|nr:8-amino-7-oxononanoate synthase [Gemmatimonadetes bacterium T265]